jgi:hypothetical protein
MRTYHEYVVPKSMPITVPMSFLSFSLSSLDETDITARVAIPMKAASNLIFNLSGRGRKRDGECQKGMFWLDSTKSHFPSEILA